VFILQVNIMNHFAPQDAHGDYFHAFILIEAGGGLILGFYMLSRESSRSARQASGSSNDADEKQ
jgi:hypothetical protein